MLSGSPTLALWCHACPTRNSMSTASGKPAGCRQLQRLWFWTSWHRAEAVPWESRQSYCVVQSLSQQQAVVCSLAWAHRIDSSLVCTVSLLFPRRHRFMRTACSFVLYRSPNIWKTLWFTHPAFLKQLSVTMIIRYLDYLIFWQLQYIHSSQK